jgi:hypothetical protein
MIEVGNSKLLGKDRIAPSFRALSTRLQIVLASSAAWPDLRKASHSFRSPARSMPSPSGQRSISMWTNRKSSATQAASCVFPDPDAGPVG